MSLRRRFAVDAVRRAARMALLPHRLRPALFRRAHVRVGAGAVIFEGVHIVGYSEVNVGARSFLNVGCYIEAQAPIIIGEDVQVADHVRLLTSTHSVSAGSRVAGPQRTLPVTVGDGAWIGSGACVLPGVVIAARSVVAAGAVVTRDTETGGIYGGVPARRIGSVREHEQ